MPTVMTLELAETLVQSAFALAAEKGQAIAVAVTDSSGDVVLAKRQDGQGAMSLVMATRKAATSANFKAPLGGLLQMVGQDETLVRALSATPEFLLLPGASPVMGDAGPIGAIGIAGGHYSVDQEISDAVTAG